MDRFILTTFGTQPCIASIHPDANHGFEIRFTTIDSNADYDNVKAKEVHRSRDRHFFFGEKDGHVSFYVCNDDVKNNDGHPSDYRWSSSSSIFNGLGYDCIECNYRTKYNFASACSLAKAKEVCEALGYGLTKGTNPDRTETVYFIFKKEHLEFQKTHDFPGAIYYRIGDIIVEPKI